MKPDCSPDWERAATVPNIPRVARALRESTVRNDFLPGKRLSEAEPVRALGACLRAVRNDLARVIPSKPRGPDMAQGYACAPRASPVPPVPTS